MTAQAHFELYAFWRSSATFRVRVALALKGLQAEERFIDIDSGKHREPAFLSINPLGALPAFIENGYPPLTQSMAILEYIDEIAPSPALLPAAARGRARVRSIAAMLTADTHPLITPRIRRYLNGAGFDDAAWRAWQTHWFTTGLQAVEARLATEADTGLFCHGDSVTLADICLASIPAVMKVFNIKVEGTPTVDAIVARCEAMPAFAGADPFHQTGAPQNQ